MTTQVFQTAADLGEFLFRIVDNGGATADRLTVLFSDGDALCLNQGGRGFSQWAESVDPAVLAEDIESGAAVDLTWSDLDSETRAHILRRVNEAFGDFAESAIAAPCRDSAEPNDNLHGCTGVGIYRDSAGALRVRVDSEDPEDDRGPFESMADAIRATLPDWYGLAGPEYHSEILPRIPEDGAPDPDRAAALATLESAVAHGWRYDSAADEWRLNDCGDGADAIAEDLAAVVRIMAED